MKKTPLRTCFVTRNKFPKGSLLRIVKNQNNEVLIDINQNLNGRGYYISKDKEVINKVIKHRILDKLMHQKLNDDIYIQLSNILEKGGHSDE